MQLPEEANGVISPFLSNLQAQRIQLPEEANGGRSGVDDINNDG